MPNSISPPTPSWLDQVNFIRYYMTNPCDVPWITYIETALPVAGEIALAMVSFDGEGFVKNILRPKNLRTKRHGRKGRRGRRGPPGVPETADMVANVLDPEKTLRPAKAGVPTRLLLEVADTIDRTDNLLFVIDSGVNLPFQSILGVINLNKEKCPGLGSYYRTGGQDSIHALVGPNQPFAIHSLVYNNNIQPGTQFGVAKALQSWNFTVSGQLRRNSGGPGTVSLRLRDTINGKTVAETGGISVDTGTTTSFSMAGTTEVGFALAWQATISSSGCDIFGTSVFGMAVG